MSNKFENCNKLESTKPCDDNLGKAAGDAYTKSGQCLFKEATATKADKDASEHLPNFGIDFGNNTIGNNNEINLTINPTNNTQDKSTAPPNNDNAIDQNIVN